MAGIIVTLVLFIFEIVKGSSFIEPVGISALNPENDPIYDPRTGRWHLDTSSDPEYVPLSSKMASSPLKVDHESHLVSRSPTPEIDILLSPSNTKSSSDESCSFSPDYDPNLYVPEKCRGYMRLWDFYSGYLEEKKEVIGWISHLGYAKDMINELSLPTSNARYTFIPSKSKNVDTIISILSDCHYLEIVCGRWEAYSNLFVLSKILEHRIKRGPVVAVYLTFTYKHAHIRIIINRLKESGKYLGIREKLVNDFPEISRYFSYY